MSGIVALLAGALLAGDPGLRIGVIGAGGAARTAFLRGAEAARAELARAGRPVTLVPLSRHSPWAGAAAGIADLIFASGSTALVAADDAALAHVAAQIATRSGVPLVTASGEESLVEAGSPWVFRTAAGDREQARALLAWAGERRLARRVRVVVPAGRDGREREAALRAACRDLGFAVTALERVVDSGPAPIAAQADEPLTLLWLDADPAIAWLRARGPAPPGMLRLGSARLAGRAGPGLVPADLDGVVIAATGTGDPAFDSGFDAVTVLAEAARAAGSVEADRVRAALAGQPGFSGRGGRFRFDERGRRVGEIRVVSLAAIPTDRP